MSARDELFKGLVEHACCFDDDEANKLLDAFARELAERIRSEGASWGSQSAAGKVYRAAADLIEPGSATL